MKYSAKEKFPFRNNDRITVTGYCVNHNKDCGVFTGFAGPMMSATFVVQEKPYDYDNQNTSAFGIWHQYQYQSAEVHPALLENNEAGLILLKKGDLYE